MFIDIMLIFDDELIKFRHTRRDYDMVRATIVKDYLRVDGVNDIVYFLTQLVTSHSGLNKKLVKNTIKVTSELIDWNSLNIFGDFINIVISDLINHYQSEAFELLSAIVKKGMEPNLKYDIISYLNVNKILEETLKNNHLNENTLYNICEIVSNIGCFVVECYGWFRFNQMNAEQEVFFKKVLEVTGYITLHTLRIVDISCKQDYKLASQLCDYLSNFICYLKSNETVALSLVFIF
jgi:hypothetical protein